MADTTPSNPDPPSENNDDKEERKKLGELAQAKDRAQLTASAAMSIIQIGLLVQLIRLGPQENPRFYKAVLGLLITSLTLQCIVGFLSIVIAHIHRRYAANNVYNAFRWIYKILQCGCCSCRGTTHRDDDEEADQLIETATVTQESLRKAEESLAEAKAKTEHDLKVQQEYKEEIRALEEMREEVAQKWATVFKELDTIRLQIAEVKTSHEKREAVSSQLEEATKNLQNAQENPESTPENLQSLQQRVDELKGEYVRLTDAAIKYELLDEKRSRLETRAMTYSKEQSEVTEKITSLEQKLLSPVNREDEYKKQLEYDKLSEKYRLQHERLVSKKRQQIIENVMTLQHYMNYILYGIAVCNMFITAMGLSNDSTGMASDSSGAKDSQS